MAAAETTFQGRSGSGSLALDMNMDTETAPVHHRSLLSATEAALNFAAGFHRDAQACRGPLERRRLHETYRDRILAVDGIAANVAAALLPFLRGARGGTGDGGSRGRWGEFDRLAQRGGTMRDRESQHMQHRSGIVAAWGLECFEYYGWHALPLPLLRQLHDLAVLVPRWARAVDLLNAQMLARHELRVARGRNKALRVGEHSPASKVQGPHSPVERCDILAALEWAHNTKAVDVVPRRQLKRSARRFGLKLDVFGMVVPSTGDDDVGNDDQDEDDDEEDQQDGRDEAIDGEGDGHLGDFARPKKRTRLSSSTGHGQHRCTSFNTVLAASHHRGAAQKNHVPTPGTGPSESEESEQEPEEPGDSKAGPGAPRAAGDDETSSDDDEGSAPEAMREEQGGGCENETSRPDTPDLCVTTGTTRDASLKSSKSRELGNTEEDETKGSRPASSRNDNDYTKGLFSCRSREDDEDVGLEEGDEEARVTDTYYDGWQQRTAQGRGRWTGSIGERTRRMMPSVDGDEAEGKGTRGPPRSGEQGQGQGAEYDDGDPMRAGLLTRRDAEEHEPALVVSNKFLDKDKGIHGSPPPPKRQPTTLLQNLQARHADTVRRLVEELSRPHASEAVSRQRRRQLSWLGSQRWARVHAEPEDRLGRSCVSSSPSSSPEHADVWYLGWGAFRRHADAGRPFPRPVVVKQEFQDSGTYDVVDYVDMLWQRFPGQRVKVQDGATGRRSSVSLAEYCLAVADMDLHSANTAATISSVTNLGRLARADEPLLSRLPRFRLLLTLADRVAGAFGGAGGHLVASDAQGCLGFDLLSFAGAFSGSCSDGVGGGSWVRCLSGVQVVAVAADLDAGDWQGFARDGRDWSPPEGRARLIVLEQDDVLLMPPGLRAVRATFALEPCLLEGAMLWDECSIPEILKGLLWAVGNRVHAHNGDDGSVRFDFQLAPLVDALEHWLDDENYVGRPSSRTAAAERYYHQTVKDRIRALRALLRPPS
ncbi:hypothetical protein LX36DRAFT_657927 [Colletotrichum falcatum]|nr:hypothetical protein LX36DRAFT_657927 [Colletotrichum falcatum]